MDTDTGKLQEHRLQHREEAEKFYGALAMQGVQVRVGMEASGQARWFERLLAELKVEWWMGDAGTRKTALPTSSRRTARRYAKVLGWERYGSRAAVEAIPAVYRQELRLWMNLYQPSVKAGEESSCRVEAAPRL